MHVMKFSVIVPVWNAEKTVEACLESILSQSVVPDEIIVIDGVSTDGTLEIVQEHLRPQDTLVSEPDKGVYDAMNKGVAKASGDIVAILNADDYWMPGTCEMVREAFAKGGEKVGIVHGNVEKIKDDRTSIVLKPVVGILSYFLIGLPTVHPATFVRRKVYQDVGEYDYKRYAMCADQDFAYRAIARGCKLKHIDCILTHMKEGGLSSHTPYSSEIDMMLDSLDQPRKFFAKKLRSLLNHKDSYYSGSYKRRWLWEIFVSIVSLGGALQRMLAKVAMRLAFRSRIKKLRAKSATKTK